MNDKNKLFEIKNLSVKYGKKFIIDGLTMDIDENEFLAIIGPNGSGKSTLVKTLVRVNEPIKGNVYFKGRPIYYDEKNFFKKFLEILRDLKKGYQPKKYRSKELGLQIAYVPQLTEFPIQTTVHEFVKMGRFPHTNALGINLNIEKEKMIINEALEQMGILDLKDKMIDELSGGQKQKTLIAMALAQQTDTIILDEPTNHLDIHAQLEIMALLHKLYHKLKKTIIIVIHDINSGLKYASKVCVIKDGKVYAHDTPTNVADKNVFLEVFKINTTIEFVDGIKRITEFKLPAEYDKSDHDDCN